MPCYAAAVYWKTPILKGGGYSGRHQIIMMLSVSGLLKPTKINMLWNVTLVSSPPTDSIYKPRHTYWTHAIYILHQWHAFPNHSAWTQSTRNASHRLNTNLIHTTRIQLTLNVFFLRHAYSIHDTRIQFASHAFHPLLKIVYTFRKEWLHYIIPWFHIIYGLLGFFFSYK